MKKEWNDRQVEELIRKAVDRSVPDLYEQVSAGAVPPLLNADDIVPPPVSRRRSRWPLALAACAALVLCLGAWSWFTPAAILTIGEEPALELSVNRFRRVLSAQGGGTLEDLSLAGEEVDDALEDVFALLAGTNGPAAVAEVPVKVDGGSWRYNRELLALAQDARADAAEDAGPDGEADVSPEPVVPTAAPVPSGSGAAVIEPEPSATAQTLLSAAEARALALAHADVKESEAVFTETEQERSDGRVYYEMEFATAAVSYQCEVDAVTGAVVQYREEPREDLPAGETYLQPEAARSAALAHAGLSAASVSDWKTELEEDNGAAYYEVEFRAGDVEYQYEIDARTGAVLRSERED